MWEKICGGSRRGAEFEVMAEEDESVRERTRRLGRGRIGRLVIREGGRDEEAGEEAYWWGGWATAEAMITPRLKKSSGGDFFEDPKGG